MVSECMLAVRAYILGAKTLKFRISGNNFSPYTTKNDYRSIFNIQTIMSIKIESVKLHKEINHLLISSFLRCFRYRTVFEESFSPTRPCMEFYRGALILISHQRRKRKCLKELRRHPQHELIKYLLPFRPTVCRWQLAQLAPWFLHVSRRTDNLILLLLSFSFWRKKDIIASPISSNESLYPIKLRVFLQLPRLL